MKVLSVSEVAERLGVSPLSVADKRWRVRVGLAGVKVGRRVVFKEEDVERLIRRGQEKLPR